MPLALKTYPTLAEAGSALADAGARYIGGGTLDVAIADLLVEEKGTANPVNEVSDD